MVTTSYCGRLRLGARLGFVWPAVMADLAILLAESPRNH